jgi:hypothetical protein
MVTVFSNQFKWVFFLPLLRLWPTAEGLTSLIVTTSFNAARPIAN